ncbi:avr2 family secreted RxLR effector peptide protein, putative [Phytophthora infestans T30-4]|uniref:RxLR effector protein n=2 Tax=Phytophthora infestans TaxID=4787 RepID=D0NN59_PHYIT|nr:avr2 family secreted RxLR effector peptide protein, putative [Phytophthora infestans T30-4]XP_002899618.1 avr2 family secreted RxLR effector peptide protein, putative [Phytophthora infestans T30-4]EEY61966.1 avr2 family secreted RxLR effector peptide protein, putative [Phytophthora infestans T30-4]EEY61978.1 avr2 family secreted RxLR effector peptide protein, putative [Phytophthora infestans T30-4]KAF4028965.1 hypothetical protein GN244_ATG19342 [Phytophthora infestans]|eukprot:XP_002899606.1 avr2 family secreted RxLR effector peptide protein, putative [Phytophthora infestans T30-4]
MRLTCILAVLVAVTFHATGNANSAVAGKASNENGVDMITTTDVHDPRLLRRVGNDEGEIVEERAKGFKEKLKAVVEKITPKKSLEKLKETVISTPDWAKIVKHKTDEAMRLGYK